MSKVTCISRIVPMLALAATATVCAPSASAAVIATLNSSTNTVTFEVQDGSWISPVFNFGSLFRYQDSSMSQMFAGTSISATATKSGGDGDWGAGLQMTLMALATDSGFDMSKVGGIQFTADNTTEDLPNMWSGTIIATFSDISMFTQGSTLATPMFGSSASGPIGVAVVPEPSTTFFATAALAAFVLRRRRK